MKTFYSYWKNFLLFTFIFMFGTLIYGQTCDYTVTVYDDYGDSWNGGSLDINVDGVPVLTGITCSGAGPETFTFTVTDGGEITAVYSSGSWAYENSYYIYDADGTEIYTDGVGGVQPSGGVVGFAVCPSCDYSVTMYDDYGDSWNGGSLDVLVDGVSILSGISCSAAGPETYTFTVYTGQAITTAYTSGSWAYENSYYIFDANNVEVLAAGVGGVEPASTGDAGFADCSGIPGCMDPTADNYDATATVDDGSCWYIMSTPYLEDFEDGGSIDPNWTQSTNDDFDWTPKTGSTGSSGTGPSSAHGGSYYIYTETSGTSLGDVATIYSPLLDLSGLTTPQLNFWYHMYGASMDPDGSIDVSISTDMGVTFTSIWTGIGNQGNQWNNAMVVLSSYSGNVVFSITGTISTSGSSYQNDFAIDDFAVEEAPSCPQPGGQSVVLTLNSAELNWTAGSSETSWDIEFLSAGTSPTGIPTYSGVTNPYLVSNLTGGDSFDWYVRADCGAGDESVWVGPNTFTIPQLGDACEVSIDYGNINDPLVSGTTTYAYDYVWYSFTLGADYGDVAVSLCGSSFDTKLEVWDDCNASSYMYYNDDNS